MDIILALAQKHLGSWTVRLGVIASIVIALEQFLPSVQAFVHSVWPAADAWLVVAAMWVGRVVGFLKQVQAAAGSVDSTSQQSGV